MQYEEWPYHIQSRPPYGYWHSMELTLQTPKSKISDHQQYHIECPHIVISKSYTNGIINFDTATWHSSARTKSISLCCFFQTFW